MSDIFISYRRGTASPYARGIYERLETQFGQGAVFMDIDTMEPGVDFVEYIAAAVTSCQVLIAVISPLPSLVYGRFPSAATARRSFDEGLDFEYENGAESCRQSSQRRMEDVLPQGDTACFIDGDGEHISMWWNEDRSPVIGNLQFAASTQPEDALAAWERVISAG